jgi:hypothetical protein
VAICTVYRGGLLGAADKARAVSWLRRLPGSGHQIARLSSGEVSVLAYCKCLEKHISQPSIL